MRRIALPGHAGLVLAALGLIGASPPTLVREGVFKHLDYVEEAGDLLGMALQIRTGPKPSIVVTTCEGACYGGRTWPLTIDGNSISFTVCDPLVDQRGRDAKCNPVHYTGHFQRGGTLIVSIPGDSASRLVLKPVRRPKPREVENLACAAC